MIFIVGFIITSFARMLDAGNNFNGFQCYICNSKTEPWCTDPFPDLESKNVTMSLLDCNVVRERLLMLGNVTKLIEQLGIRSHQKYINELGMQDVCFKLEIKAGGPIVRGCGNVCIDTNATKCDICETEGCNFANSFKNSFSSYLLIFIFIEFYFYY